MHHLDPQELAEELVNLKLVNPKVTLMNYVESELWEEFPSMHFFMPGILNGPNTPNSGAIDTPRQSISHKIKDAFTSGRKTKTIEVEKV